MYWDFLRQDVLLGHVWEDIRILFLLVILAIFIFDQKTRTIHLYDSRGSILLSHVRIVVIFRSTLSWYLVEFGVILLFRVWSWTRAGPDSWLVHQSLNDYFFRLPRCIAIFLEFVIAQYLLSWRWGLLCCTSTAVDRALACVAHFSKIKL